MICGEPKYEQTFLLRLAEAGTVLTTLHQCLFQWALEPENEPNNELIMKLAKELAAIGD